MEKRYQVFISSTKKDLDKVRRDTALTLLNNKFIPVGMEQWGATPLDSWSLIKKFIDQCDYYVLIIGGLYGSINRQNGLSFTESEYDYAVEKNIPVLAFLNNDLDNLLSVKVESSAKRKKMLEKFREKVRNRWNVDFWDDEKVLPGLIASRLDRAIDSFDRPGWIPGNSIPENLQRDVEAILKPCKEQGIGKIVPDGKADSSTMASNLEASKEIRIMVTSGTRFLDGYRRAISKAVNNGANIRLLVPKPESDFVIDVGESEREGNSGKIRGKEIAQEIKEADARFSEYMEEARRIATSPTYHLGTISIGYYTTHLRSSMILCDDRWGWLTITLPPLRASETLSFELYKTNDEYFLQDCLRHFDRTWEIVESRHDVRRI